MGFIYRMPTRTPADPVATVRSCPPCAHDHRCNQGDGCPARTNGADPLGDDHAERHSAWGALEECATEGGKHREPTDTGSYPGPSVGWVLFLAVACIASVGACWVLAPYLPLFPGR